jgi:hypothetical protein
VRSAFLGILLLSACGTGPRRDFDSGVVLHFILVRERPPKSDTTLRPVFTVGDSVVHAPEITFGPDDALAQESAAVLVRRDKKARTSFWDPVTRTAARETLDTRHELWIVVDLDDLGGTADLTVYRRPPNREIQEWIPLAELSN